ncbi:hypothetical protein N7462_004523 [Penicillium macrosclerotiorum]|uniref:uncharacterized protein n=1 Tax=Penicillium macrosclerotiorum TaxID=303699 RepID=UPI00254709C4|nr:uncharacterized protein N7462_004523 [Penicillium macrosclerotiorum]KAJ5690131.1 hypothetical protein N7462_004523 [Penicillium macrosclerotiorum]
MAAPPRHSTMMSISNSGTPQSTGSGDKPAVSQPPSSPQPTTGLRVPSNRKTIYDRHLNRNRTAELSRASFAYLFAEMVTYAQRRVTGIQDLEKRLNEQGYPLGLRLLDLLFYRSTSTSSSALSSSSTSSSPPNRPLRIITLLHLIHGPLWRLLFGRSADALEHSVSPDTPNEYMITDNDPLVNTYVSVPREMSMLNCAAFVAGIIEGVCDGCGFEAKVSAHNQPTEMWPSRTVFLLRFGDSVMEREKVLERAGIK